MNWFRKPVPAVTEPPPMTGEDFLNLADADLRAAEREFAQAHLAVNHFYVNHREYLPVTDVGGKVMLTIKPPNAELAALLSRENHAIQNRNQAMERRVEMRKRFRPETTFVGGVKV